MSAGPGAGSEGAAIDTQKGSRKMLIGLILVSVALAGVAQVTLKIGVNHVTDAHGGTLHLNGTGLKALLTSPVVWGGLALFGVSGVLWLFALSRATLSFAYPFAALGYVIIVAASVPVLHESVPPVRWVGVALIVIGVVLVGQTTHT
jgi:multidrug transporter EmrE-like cation transporter